VKSLYRTKLALLVALSLVAFGGCGGPSTSVPAQGNEQRGASFEWGTTRHSGQSRRQRYAHRQQLCRPLSSQRASRRSPYRRRNFYGVRHDPRGDSAERWLTRQRRLAGRPSAFPHRVRGDRSGRTEDSGVQLHSADGGRVPRERATCRGRCGDGASARRHVGGRSSWCFPFSRWSCERRARARRHGRARWNILRSDLCELTGQRGAHAARSLANQLTASYLRDQLARPGDPSFLAGGFYSSRFAASSRSDCRQRAGPGRAVGSFGRRRDPSSAAGRRSELRGPSDSDRPRHCRPDSAGPRNPRHARRKRHAHADRRIRGCVRVPRTRRHDGQFRDQLRRVRHVSACGRSVGSDLGQRRLGWNA
jgi:hypothetical protein